LDLTFIVTGTVIVMLIVRSVSRPRWPCTITRVRIDGAGGGGGRFKHVLLW